MIFGYELEVKKVGVKVSEIALSKVLNLKLDIYRWLQATGILITRLNCSHLIDLPVCLEACLLPSYGHSSHTL